MEIVVRTRIASHIPSLLFYLVVLIRVVAAAACIIVTAIVITITMYYSICYSHSVMQTNCAYSGG